MREKFQRAHRAAREALRESKKRGGKKFSITLMELGFTVTAQSGLLKQGPDTYILHGDPFLTKAVEIALMR